MKDPIRNPTDGELAILGVLWSQSRQAEDETTGCTVRQVHEAMDRGRPTAYTTTLKLMQIMHDKGLLLRDDARRSHVYRAAVTEQQTQGSLVRSLAARAFGGSASALVMRALATDKTSKKELAAIRTLLDELEAGERR